MGGLSPSPPPCLQTAASDGSTQKQIHWVERLTNSLRETIFLWQLPEPAVYVDPRDSVCDFGSSADSHVRQARALKTEEEKKTQPTITASICFSFLFSGKRSFYQTTEMEDGVTCRELRMGWLGQNPSSLVPTGVCLPGTRRFPGRRLAMVHVSVIIVEEAWMVGGAILPESDVAAGIGWLSRRFSCRHLHQQQRSGSAQRRADGSCFEVCLK